MYKTCTSKDKYENEKIRQIDRRKSLQKYIYKKELVSRVYNKTQNQ